MVIKLLLTIPIVFFMLGMMTLLFRKHMTQKGMFLISASLIYTCAVSIAAFVKFLKGSLLFPVEKYLNCCDIFLFKLGVGIRLDGVSVGFLCVINICILLLLLYAFRKIESEAWEQPYSSAVSFALAALNMMIISNDLLIFFVCMEILTCAAYAAFYVSKKSEGTFTYKNWIFLMCSDMCFLAGIITIFAETGTLQISQLALHISRGFMPEHVLIAAGLYFIAGVFGRLSFFPLYSWLYEFVINGEIYAIIIAVFGMLASGLIFLVKNYVILMHEPVILTLIRYISAANIIAGLVSALISNNLKKILYALIITQVGSIVLAYSMKLYEWSIFYVIDVMLLLCVSIMAFHSIFISYGSHYVSSMGALSKRMPFTSIAFFVITLIISFFPLLSNFCSVGEGEIIFQNVNRFNIILVLSTFFTSVFIGRVCFSVFFGQPRDIKLFEKTIDPPYGMTMPLAAGVLVLMVISIMQKYTKVLDYVMYASVYITEDMKPRVYMSDITAPFIIAFVAISALFLSWIVAQQNIRFESFKEKRGSLDVYDVMTQWYVLVVSVVIRRCAALAVALESSILGVYFMRVILALDRINKRVNEKMRRFTLMPTMFISKIIYITSEFNRRVYSGRVAQYIFLAVSCILAVLVIEIFVG